ncbi:MAG: histidinol-phosphate transaminase [Rhodobacteraceae bacterium]|nr:histidinol-phosphate transaminase [Paracoccaceae bacterium]
MTQIKPQPGILAIAPYRAGQAQVAGRRQVLKLSSNENPYGPSPKACAAFHDAGQSLHRYPSSTHKELREAIANTYGLDADRLIIGAGSDEIIALLCQAYAGPQDEVLHSAHGFAMYRISALAAGATPIAVAERNRVADVEALLAAAGERTRLVFLANPNNPTGTMVPHSALARLADGLPAQAILVLDGAYAEYVADYDGGAQLAETRCNTVMTRTFSKLYGLGGLRIGWGYGPPQIIDVLNRVRGPFNITSPSLAAAKAAVLDQAYAADCQRRNAHWREWLAAALARHGVPSDPSCANFILARFADPAEAAACDAALQRHGIILRRVEEYGLPNCLRITVGDEAACRLVAETIGDFVAKTRKGAKGHQG